MSFRPSPDRQGSAGVALITMLITVGLISFLAISLIDRHQISITQTGLFLEQDNAFEQLMSGESYARYLLREDFLSEQKEKHTGWQKWSSPLKTEAAVLSLRIQDLQALFNLNSLTGNLAGQQFSRLLNEARVNPAAAALASDWLDSDQRTRLQGAEDATYLLVKPAYRAANTYFHSVLELVLLGRSPLPADHLRRLYPLVSALPVAQPMRLNINTAHPLVLRAIAPELPIEEAATILNRDKPYTRAAALIADHPALESVLDSLVFTSNFFRADVHYAYEGGRTMLSSVLYRDPASGETRVISRDFNLPAWVAEPEG